MSASLELWNQRIDLVTSIVTLLGGLVAATWAYAKLIVEKGLLPPSQFDIDCKVVGMRDDRQVLEVTLLIENKGSSPLIVSDLHVDILYACEGELAQEVLTKDMSDAKYGSLRFPHSLLKRDLGFEGTFHLGKPGETLRLDELKQNPWVKVDKKGVVALEYFVPDENKKAGCETAREYRLVLGTPGIPTADARKPPRRNRGFPLLRSDTFVQAGVEQAYTLVTAIPGSAVQALVFGSFRYGSRPSGLQLAILGLARGLGLVQFTLAHVTQPHTAQRVFDLSAMRVE